VTQSSPLATFALFATLLADAAGPLLRRYFRTPLLTETKADLSPVTEADRGAEAVMRALIMQRYPDHGIIGEEMGGHRADAEWVWVLDPIDGTKAFMAGAPTFGTLIGLCHKGIPVVGIIDQPISCERWIGVRGQPTTLRGNALHARIFSHTPELGKALLAATAPDMFTTPTERTSFAQLQQACRFTRFGLDCYAYGLLAAGQIDLVCEASMKPHDIMALVPVIEGVGGLISDWTGRPFTLDGQSTQVLAAGNQDLHRSALALLA